MSVLKELGVKKVINAWGPMTVIGGSLMHPDVVQAMTEAAQQYMDLNELQRKAGARIAQLIGVEGCYIASGCAAGIAIATAAVVAGNDPAKIARLPDTTGMRNEIVVQRAHRNGYDHAVRQVGVKLVEIGGGRGSLRWELEAAIGPNTAAVFHTYAQWTFDLPLRLSEVVEVAHAHRVPVIVDAAAEVPPLKNLKGLSATGADVVVFSGGKGLRGPQSTGLVLAKPSFLEACARNASPNHSIGRPMKVGKEEMVGLVKAIEIYLAQDHAAVYRRWNEQLDVIEKALASIPGMTTQRTTAGYSEGIPATQVTIDPKVAHTTATALAQALAEGDPSIRVGVKGDVLTVVAQFIEAGEEAIIAERFRQSVLVPVAG